ncbi:hypothetical protein AB0D34_44265, partial [Streptomyces sp. NPDC048420]|uniref:hypothetical protein n=1 Tax=Streptomyces sp. NPDC048420 TaxID=3155755 RepID=UPI00343815F8
SSHATSDKPTGEHPAEHVYPYLLEHFREYADKRETLRGAHHYPGAELCRRTVFRWLTRYNTRRRHSANGHLSPVDYEDQHQQESDKLTLAA